MIQIVMVFYQNTIAFIVANNGLSSNFADLSRLSFSLSVYSESDSYDIVILVLVFSWETEPLFCTTK